jgi:hypothetical protein
VLSASISRTPRRATWRLQLSVSGVYVLLTSFALASCEITDRFLLPGSSVPVVSAYIALGPGSGWHFAFAGERLSQGAPFLWAMTAFPLAPFLVWCWSRNPIWLGIAATFWPAAGYLCTVAIWV